MGDSVPSLLDLVSILMSSGLSPETSLRVSKEIDDKFDISSRSRVSDPATRERWRTKKARQRARKAVVPGGQYDSALTSFLTTNSQDTLKKESKSGIASPGDKPKRVKAAQGEVLSVDWKPTEDHYAQGGALGMSREAVDGYASRMRNWAEANAHRAVARKSGTKGWNAAFRNWLADKADRNVKGGLNGTAQSAGGGKVGFSGIGARLRRAERDGELPIGQSSDDPGQPGRR